MKITLTLGFLLLCSAAVHAGPCLPGTLQSYINLGATGCQSGDTQFSNFAVEPGQSFATPINPQAIQITPGGAVISPTLLFTLNSSATAGNLLESFFRFDVSGFLTSASITLNAPTVTGDGDVTGVLDVCAGGSFSPGEQIGCPTTAGTAVAFATQGTSGLSDSVSFSPTSFFDVFVDLTIDGGIAGSASLPSASVSIGAVPEPSTVLLIAAGLAMIVIPQARRRRRS
jgi:hypothetical protein